VILGVLGLLRDRHKGPAALATLIGGFGMLLLFGEMI
jgi:hypothetical protein